jgi:signal transduction histidine kinase
MINAAEAMSAVPDGSRVLNINSKLRRSDEVVIACEDCGPGVDPKIMDRIFDSFFTTKPQGMGMGLSICRSIIEAHNGRLWVSASSDHGSVFNILLPVIDTAVEWRVRSSTQSL